MLDISRFPSNNKTISSRVNHIICYKIVFAIVVDPGCKGTSCNAELATREPFCLARGGENTRYLIILQSLIYYPSSHLVGQFSTRTYRWRTPEDVVADGLPFLMAYANASSPIYGPYSLPSQQNYTSSVSLGGEVYSHKIISSIIDIKNHILCVVSLVSELK